MDNQSAPASFNFGTIPAGTCFPGNMRDKFQQLIDQILNNGTVSIDITEEIYDEISALSARIQDVQNQIDALDPEVRTDSIPLIVGDNNYVITFATAMPDADYTINIEIIDAAGTGTAGATWAVVGDTKTSTGVTLRFYDVAAAQTSFTYIVKNY